ncbi:hypothetical protein ACWCXK_38270 [Streptomyces sp. NPDC001739]
MSKPSAAAGMPDELQRRLGVSDAVVIGLGSMIGTAADRHPIGGPSARPGMRPPARGRGLQL